MSAIGAKRVKSEPVPQHEKEKAAFSRLFKVVQATKHFQRRALR
jgi:hypothetical protein